MITRGVMLVVAASFVAAPALARDPVAYWPRKPLDHGCVGHVYAGPAGDLSTRSFLVGRDGAVFRGPLHQAGRATIRQAVSAERAIHWHGCW
jgi:hypothetical protein